MLAVTQFGSSTHMTFAQVAAASDVPVVPAVKTMLDAMLLSGSRRNGKGVRFHHSAEHSELLTYETLGRTARSEAMSLRRFGLHTGDRVVLAFETGIDFLRGFYATMYGGFAAVPAPMTVSGSVEDVRSRLLEIATDSGSRCILTTAKTAARMGLRELDLDLAIWELPPEPGEAEQEGWNHPGTVSTDIALIQYTSGSTGLPKGVVVSHANLVANQRSLSAVTASTAEPVVVGWLPHYHDMGLIGLYLHPVFEGIDLVATSPSQFLRRPVNWLRLISKYRATTTVAPDFAYTLCERLVTDQQIADLDLSSLRTVITGAEPVKSQTLTRFAARFAAAGFDPRAFTPAYGMAETTLLTSAKRSGDAFEVLRLDSDALASGVAKIERDGATELVSCGVAAPEHRVQIVDPDSLHVAGMNRVGEIWVAGPSVTVGYWGNPRDTEKRFGATLAGDASSYFRTGDLGFLWNGELVITGRISDVMNVRGRNVYPQDLESAVASAISPRGEPVSAAFEHSPGRIVVVVEGRKDLSVDQVDTVRKDVARRLSVEPLTIVVVRTGGVPRTSSGKVQRNATRQKLIRGDMRIVHVAGQLDGIDLSERRMPIGKLL